MRTIRRILVTAVTVMLSVAAIRTASFILHHTYSDRLAPFFKDNRHYDVLFFGTSHMFCAVSPMQLWHDYGITSYNFGVQRMSIPLSYWMMRCSVSHCKPQIAVLDIHPWLIDGISDAQELNRVLSDEKLYTDKLNRKSIDYFSHFGLDAVPFSREKFAALNDLFSDTRERIEYAFPYALWHNRYEDLTFAQEWDYVFHRKADVNKGWYPQFNIAKPNEYPQVADAVPLLEDCTAYAYIRNFVSYCRNNGITPVLMNIPFPATETEQKNANSVAKFARELDVPYYNMLFMDIVDYHTDCDDPHSHLNPSGARKVTDFLGLILHEAYAVPDHRTESGYSSWDSDYVVFRQFLVQQFELYPSLRQNLMILYAAGFSADLFLPDGVQLDAVEQLLVSQLGESLSIEPAAASSPFRARLVVHDAGGGKDFERMF